MPILDVEIVLSPGESMPPDFAKRLADCSCEVFDTTPCTTWVKVRSVPAECFAENGGGPLAGAYPIFVSVLMVDMPPRKSLVPVVNRLKLLVSGVTGRPVCHIHVFFLPEGAGRVFMGGRLTARN